LPLMSREGLNGLFISKSMTLLPSRWDTFNLIALESLFSGCPIAVSTRAGVFNYLKENHPNIPFIPLDIENLFSSIPDIEYALSHYEEYRRDLVDKLLGTCPQPKGPNLEEIYNETHCILPNGRPLRQ